MGTVKLGSKQTIRHLVGRHVVGRCVIGITAMSLLGAALAGGQTSPSQTAATQPAAQTAAPAGQPQKQVMAEDFFKNVQVLKGIPVDQFMGTMGIIAASLSVNCTECHVSDFAVDTAKKKKARAMMIMMININKENFGGARNVTCYTCHRSGSTPKATASLAEQYGSPPDPDPNDVTIIGPPAPNAPTAEQILDRFVQALGGAEKLAGLTSFTGKGTYEGFDTDHEQVPAEVYAKAPSQRAVIAHRFDAQNITVYNGSDGWVAMTNTRLPLSQFTGGGLDGARLDAQMDFPAAIKQYASQWRVGFPPMSIDDHDVDIVQGIAPEGTRVKFFFDKKTGLLLRQVRFAATALGFNPTEVDYSDYRDVAGVKVPYHWTVTWTDGRSDYIMKEIQPNVPIDPSKFNEPVVPPAPPPKPATP
jgi:photosynthetic reaction center cytochrome c subunit